MQQLVWKYYSGNEGGSGAIVKKEQIIAAPGFSNERIAFNF